MVDESGVDNEEESTVPSEESEETEASLLEIKHLLLGVQKTLHTMQSESRKMSDELKELRASFDSQGRQISQLKQSLAKANKANEELQEQLKKQNKKIQFYTRTTKSNNILGKTLLKSMESQRNCIHLQTKLSQSLPKS